MPGLVDSSWATYDRPRIAEFALAVKRLTIIDLHLYLDAFFLILQRVRKTRIANRR